MGRAMLISGSTQVEFSVVETETPSRTNTITDNPVEQGVNIADHVKPEPISFSFSGMIAGDDANDKRQKIVNFRDNGTILTYSGRNVLTNMVIESFDSTHDKDIRNGFKFNMTLKQIRVAKLQTVTLAKVPIPARPQQKKGKQTTKKKTTSASKSTSLTQKALAHFNSSKK